jgi:nucleoprotein TPR
VEKATSEFRSAPPTTSEEVTKQHAEELRALEERLVAKHQEELNKAIEAAIAKVKESQPAPAPAPGTAATPEDQKAAIDAAVTTALANKEAEQKAKHDAAIEKAVESGRLEGTMKLRLKDTQLVRSQNRVKELEKQIEEWKKTGVITSEAGHGAYISASCLFVCPSSTSSFLFGAVSYKPLLHPVRGVLVLRVFRVNLLLRVPPLVRRWSTCAGSWSGWCAGKFWYSGCRCAWRGPWSRQHLRARRAVAAGGTAGVAIMGAASKRSREEGEVSTEDSLSKRMKPATAAAATTSTTPRH